MNVPEGLGGRPLTEAEIIHEIRSRGPALVALSGGVDSAVVAALARSALGDALVAATVVSGSVSSREVASARDVADRLGLRHLEVGAEPLEDLQYRANGPDRCFRCRSVESRALREAGESARVAQYLDGIHRDDLGDDRPGIRAMDAAGFLHPLLWAGWGKIAVRRYAQAAGLPNWDRPSNACLASRVARGEEISGALLERIERAEGILYDRGFRQVRVRVRGGTARIEVDREGTPRLLEGELREEVTARIRALGFTDVTIDPNGYRSREQLPVVR